MERMSLRVPNLCVSVPGARDQSESFGGDQVDLTVSVRAPFQATGMSRQPILSRFTSISAQNSEKFHFSIEIGTSF